ncbi:Uncharacterized protein YR821_3351 [Yersinia ruckeri]|uniref:Uncharacterized protein n=1 Tax=Yersinia ruckeri TaxID=29486 RepID=A0A0A8VHY7_YERRU|nr:hypothetical protein yruck0001_430 [Yersinia ruckeri ATCC 29473]QTD78267.1 Uncharacterized protein YR821_3351 [Yersinia ruckeri]CEK29180.1 hypothetical protein CSF007_17385 [Yersinia ruckeri]
MDLLTLLMNVKGMFTQVNTNKRGVLHDVTLKRITPYQRTAHKVG